MMFTESTPYTTFDLTMIQWYGIFLQEKAWTAKATARVAMLNMRFVFLVMMMGFSNRGLLGAKLVYYKYF